MTVLSLTQVYLMSILGVGMNNYFHYSVIGILLIVITYTVVLTRMV